MAIPNVNITINDGGVGIIVPGVGALPVNVAGWCSSGPGATPTPIGAGAVSTLTSTFGVGTAVELAAAILANGAQQGVIVTRVYDGTVSSTWTRAGGSVGVCTDESSAPLSPYGTPTSTGSTGAIISCSTGGALGTAQFEVSFDGGVTFSVPIVSSAAWSSAPYWSIPGGPGGPSGLSGLVVSLSAATYTSGTTFTGAITTTTGASSSVTQLPVPGGSLTGAGAVSMDATNNPQDAYSVVVLISTSGVLGVGQFEYSLDGGLTFSNPILIPSGGGPTSLGSSGIAVDWANTGGSGATNGFIVGETYNFTTTPPGITATDILNVGEAITGNAQQWDWMHVVGRPTSASAASSLFTTMNTIGSFWATNYRYSFVVYDTPICTVKNNISASLIADFANSNSDWVSVGGGDCNIVSAISGSEIQRCASWSASIWGSTLPIGTDLAEVALGNLPFVAQILWNENNADVLDAARFTTMRTIPTLSGFYMTNARMMSNASSSDITYWQSRRVLNQACRIAYAFLVQYLSKNILVNAATGTLDKGAATAMQNALNRALNDGLTGQVSGVASIVSTTNDVLTTQTLNVTVSVVPLFYPKVISATIGFLNPALSTQ